MNDTSCGHTAIKETAALTMHIIINGSSEKSYRRAVSVPLILRSPREASERDFDITLVTLAESEA